MKRILLSSLLLVGCTVNVGTPSKYVNYQPNIDNIAPKYLSASEKTTVADFAKLTTPHIFNEDVNTIYSPTSYLLALCMLSEIATNELHGELLDTLGFANQDEVRAFSKNLFEASFANDESKLRLANSTWANQSLIPNSQTIDNLVDYYYSSYYYGNLYSKEASDALNAWLKDVTEGLITLDNFSSHPFDVPDLLAVLFSSIYASSQWEFEPNECDVSFENSDGTRLSVPGLSSLFSAPYTMNDDFEAAYLPLSDGFELLAIKPTTSVNDFLQGDLLDVALDKTNYTLNNLSLKLPKFEVESEIDLLAVSKQIGLENIKSSNQLGNLADPSCDVKPLIGYIQQNAKILVDETGVKAAAVTSIGIVDECAPLDPISFNLDRQFAYVLVYHGVPHFIGTLYNL